MEEIDPFVTHASFYCCLSVEFYSEGACNFEYSSEARISISAECSIQTFTAQPRIFGNLRHAFCACDIAECSGDADSIVGRFFEPGIKVRSHFFRCAELFRNIIGNSFGVHVSFARGLSIRCYS